MKLVTDEELYQFVKTLPCIACGRKPGRDAHHVKSRGAAGGRIDTVENLMPLCRMHHTMPDYGELCIHHGMTRFVQRYPSVKDWLQKTGWYICELNKRWTRDENFTYTA